MRIIENTSTKIFTPFALDSMLRKKEKNHLQIVLYFYSNEWIEKGKRPLAVSPSILSNPYSQHSAQ
jgi:hypothetical protein